ncbi:MAG: hypothetical protein WBD07_09720 [Vicinamibacterales bacterium]
MADPLRYFSDLKQREMVSQVWSLAATKTEFYSTICRINQYRFTSPDSKRVLHAKDWLTYWRQDGGPDDNDAINRQLGHAPNYYSGECIADVEHFFVAAFMEVAIGPALTQVGVVGWETFDILLKRPVLKALEADAQGRSVSQAFFDGFPRGFQGWFDSVKWNYGQAIRAQSGIAFGADLIEGQSMVPVLGDGAIAIARSTAALRDAVNFVQNALAEPPPPRTPSFGTAPIGTCPIPPNPSIPDKEFPIDLKDPTKRSLSAVAKTLYGSLDYWPLLWWHNPRITNPNRLQGVLSIRYREATTYSASDLAAAKAAAPSWKNYPL